MKWLELWQCTRERSKTGGEAEFRVDFERTRLNMQAVDSYGRTVDRT